MIFGLEIGLPKASGSRAVWWVLGGMAAGFFFCVIPLGGLLAWWLYSTLSPQPPAAGPVAENRRAIEGDNPPPPQEQQRANLNQQKLPPFVLPPEAEAMPPENFQPPAEPPFKPFGIPQPSAPHLNIRPPKLPEERVAVPLPSTVGDTAVGGGGRFLILYLPRQRKLAIFDVNAARVVKYLSFADDIKFAAGMDKLLVALPDKTILQRWSLTTLERELSMPLAGDGRAMSLTMGSASNGPLLIQRSTEGRGIWSSLDFFDIRTLKPLAVKWERKGGAPPNDARYIRASANGFIQGICASRYSLRG